MRIPSRFRAGAGVISPAGRTVAALAVVSALIGWRLGWREALWTSAASAVVFLVAAAFMIGSGRVSGDLDVELIGEELESIDYHQLIDHVRRAFERLVAPP